MTADELLSRIDDPGMKVNRNLDPTNEFTKWVESISGRLSDDEIEQAVYVGALIRDACGVVIPYLSKAEIDELLKSGRPIF